MDKGCESSLHSVRAPPLSPKISTTPATPTLHAPLIHNQLIHNAPQPQVHKAIKSTKTTTKKRTNHAH